MGNPGFPLTCLAFFGMNRLPDVGPASPPTGVSEMAKPAKKLKNLLYLRASFSDKKGEKNATLEEYLRRAYDALPNVEERKIEFAGRTWFGNWNEKNKDCFLFQFSAATPGEDATTVPTASLNVKNIELASAKAPDGCEFADGDVICCVCGNDVFACCSHFRFSAVQAYLLGLFEASECGEHAMTLQIDRPGNFNKLKIIRAEGIRSIILNASLDSAEFQRLDNVKEKGLLRTCIRSLVDKDKKLMEAAVNSHGRFKLELSMPKKGQVGGAAWLDGVGEDVISDILPYRIETKSGKIITPDEITISKKERMEPFGKTVFRTEAVQKLTAFKDEFLTPDID
jgi:hypothetical protein